MKHLHLEPMTREPTKADSAVITLCLAGVALGALIGAVARLSAYLAYLDMVARV